MKVIKKKPAVAAPDNEAESDGDGLGGAFLEIDEGLIDLDPANPNQMSNAGFEGLVKDISTDGMIDPIQVVQTGDRYLVVGGEHRLRACRVLGYTKIPAVVMTADGFKDQAQRRARMVKLNMRRGKISPSKMIKLYEEVAATTHPDQLQEMFGIDDDAEWKKLVKSMIGGLDPAMVPKEAKAQILADAEALPASQKTPDGLSKIIAKAVNKLNKAGGQGSHIVFHAGGSDSVVFQVSGGAVKIAAALVAISNAGVDVSSALEEALSGILKKIGGTGV